MIDNKKISNFPLSIVKDLQDNGFQAYLVGGCVRDLLCKIIPKDFDIATNATPEQIRKIFKASRIIGRRFKLVHVFNRSELIEVATFRSGEDKENDGSLVTDRTGRFSEITSGVLLSKILSEETSPSMLSTIVQFQKKLKIIILELNI